MVACRAVVVAAAAGVVVPVSVLSLLDRLVVPVHPDHLVCTCTNVLSSRRFVGFVDFDAVDAADKALRDVQGYRFPGLRQDKGIGA